MDELLRLSSFRSDVVPIGAARAQAAFALEQAIAGRRRHLSRPALVLIAFVVAAALATGAYALYQAVIVGSPAPASVKKAERLESEVRGELIPQAHRNPNIEIDKTHAAAVINSSVGPIYLWVAPNKRGSNCSWLEIVAMRLPNGQPNLSGGCGGGRNDFYAGINFTRVNGKPLGLIQGYVGIKGATNIQIRFANGNSKTIELSDKYVLAETDPNNAIKTIIVKDAKGKTLATRTVPSPRSPLQTAKRLRSAVHPTGPWHTVATLRTYRTHSLLVEKSAPGNHRTICSELIGGGGTGSGCPSRPLTATSLDDIGPTQIGPAPNGLFLFDGPIGKSIHSLELDFEDGTHVIIPIHHGFILFQVNPKNYRSGHRPTALIARNARGRIVNTRKFHFLR